MSLPPEGWGVFTGICQSFRVTLVRNLRSSSVSVWHSMAIIGSCGTCTWFFLPVVGQHFWSPFLETQIRPYPSALPAGGEETVAWWEKNRFQWSQQFNKKHNAWNCSQICWICTIIHAGSKWFFKTLTCEIYSSLQQSRSLPFWMASSRVDLLIWVRKWSHGCRWVGWLVFQNQQKQEEKYGKTKHWQSAIPFLTEFITWSNTLRCVGAKNCIGRAKDWSVQQRTLAFELGKRNWLVKLS